MFVKTNCTQPCLAFRCIEIENAAAITQAYPAIVTAEYQYDAWGVSIENQMMATPTMPNPVLTLFGKFAATNRYKYNDKEYISDSKLYDYGARHYDPISGRWWVVDPLASKYPSLSPHCFVANNPIRYIDPDGREIVDPQGRRAITYDKKGGMHFTKYATADIRRVAGALSLTTEGAAQLKRINSSDIKTKINVSSDSKIETRADGSTSYTYGGTEQGNINNPPTYSKYQNEDGTFGIKEATITIYEGTLKEGIKAGSGLEHEGLTLEQAIGAVAGHEGIHATDKAEINKDIKAEFGTKKQQAAREITREVKPEAVEKKIIDQSKKLNE